MKFPKYLTTVTTFSKIVAAILFILFPLLGFYLGLKYNRLIAKSDKISGSTDFTQLNNWKKFQSAKNRFSISYPPEINLITEENRQNGSFHFFTSDYSDPNTVVSSSAYGDARVSIQIDILDSAEYELPYTGRVIISKKNLDPFLGKEGTKGTSRGFLRSRPTSKSYSTSLKNMGDIVYRIFDNDRLITVIVSSTNLKKVPYYTLNKIIDSFRL